MSKYTIYLRRNLINGKCYVGQTSNFKRRNNEWRCLKKCYNKHIDVDRELYGLDKFTVEVLAEADCLEDAYELEQRFIADYNSICPNGYNISTGGHGTSGVEGYWKDKHRSEETKQKIREGNKGKHFSEEHKQKLSEAHKGKPSPMYGKHHTDETKQKISEANKIPVYQYTLDGELVAIWSSAKDAEEKLGIKRSNISACCKGKLKSAGGYIWSFKPL